MKKIFICILTSLAFISSCKEEETHSRTEFPDITVMSFEFTDSIGFGFRYKDKEYNVMVDSLHADQVYAYNKVSFCGSANAKRIFLTNEDDISKDVTDYLYSHYAIIEDPTVYFVNEKIESIKIYSDREYNSIQPGNELNAFFSVTGRFLQMKNNQYLLFEGDILRLTSYQNMYIPMDIIIQIEKRPLQQGKYSFFLELQTNKRKYSVNFVTIQIT